MLIGYVDNHGRPLERLVDPLRVEAGQLTAHDHRSDDTRTFAIHRITTVRPASAGSLSDGRTVIRWTSSGTPTPRRTSSTPRCRTRRRCAACCGRGPGCTPQCRDRDAMLLRKFQRELRPVFEASARGEVREVTRLPQRAAAGRTRSARRSPTTTPATCTSTSPPATRRRRPAGLGVADRPGHPGLRPRRDPARASAPPRPARTSTSTPRPTGPGATAPTGAPRAPTSPPTAPGSGRPSAEPASPAPSLGR